MSRSGFLEEFSGTLTSDGPVAKTPPKAVDDAEKSASFDEGYNCGWQDGVASIENDETRQLQALSEAMHELKFTYFEARQHVLKSVRPVLEAMVDAALPDAVASSLGAHVVELLAGLANKSESTVILSCAPASEGLLSDAVATVCDFPITIETEASLTDNQVVLHFEQGQSRVDLDATLAAIRTSIDEFYATPTEEHAKHA